MVRLGTTTRIEIRVERAGGRTLLRRLRGGDLLTPRPLPPRGALARVALVQSAASLLAGDRLELHVGVAAGAQLELVEVAAMLAQAVRGGAPAELRVRVGVEAGGRLHWNARPLVLAAGCDLRRHIRIGLEAGARVLLRDTVVFGRTGEAPGRYSGRMDVLRDGRPLHIDALDTAEPDTLRSPAVLGGARVLDALALYGARATGEAVMTLAGPGSLALAVADDAADAERRIGPLHRAWAGEFLSGAREYAGGAETSSQAWPRPPSPTSSATPCA